MFKLKIFNRISPFFCLALALTFLPKLGMSQDENEEAVVDPALEAIQALEEKESFEAVSDPGSIQELEQIKAKDMDKDGKLQLIPKDKIKEVIGRSPDDSDCLMMRMWFSLTPTRSSGSSTFYPHMQH